MVYLLAKTHGLGFKAKEPSVKLNLEHLHRCDLQSEKWT